MLLDYVYAYVVTYNNSFFPTAFYLLKELSYFRIPVAMHIHYSVALCLSLSSYGTHCCHCPALLHSTGYNCMIGIVISSVDTYMSADQ